MIVPRVWIAASRHRFTFALLAALCTTVVNAEEPLWAYGFTKPGAPTAKAVSYDLTNPALPGGPSHKLRANEDVSEQTRKRTLPGSKGTYSLLEIRNGNDVVDWFPEDHGPLTPVLRHGPAKLGTNAYGCAFCHMPNGKGRPENAPVAGLPAAYFVRQMHDLREGVRTSADVRKTNTILMRALAAAMTENEITEAANYFASLPATPWIRVVETDRVPRTKIVSGMFIPIEQEATEPLAGRIIEVPEKPDQTELLRDPHSGFIAYVPFGSVRRGEVLVTKSATTVVNGRPAEGKTVACMTCHGPDLRGVAEVPGIAGRSPSYIARQLYDVQQGTRKAPLAQLMVPVVANLDQDDIVAISAYVASLSPGN